ncbi:MAG: DUF1295 domain-containing protein [Akkermansiaceae bacterium]|jgi:steroid 5-alpha reductase family enzyme
MNDWTIFLSVGLLIHALFFIGWLVGKKVTNYSLVDALWAFGIALSGILFALLGNGDEPKRIAAGALAAFWGIRLGYHLQKRIRKHHPTEDSRYQKLREIWQGRVHSAFFWFFQAQALSVLILALPYFLVSRDATPWGLFETIGLTIALIGICGEILSDHRLSTFVENRTDPNAICKTGLWRYSRHPNYFFEMVIWIGVYLFACGSAFGWATLHAPVIITYLLLKVTGIPPSEASSLKKKGDRYRQYQRTTSPFIPLPPKSP